MKTVLLLVDLQEDYLAEPGLEPHRETIVAGAAELLERARRHGVPVLHLWTTIEPGHDARLPHWKAAGRWACVAGTPGHAAPAALQPRQGELVFHKTGYGGFEDPALPAALPAGGPRLAIVAGVHTHACVRQAALDLFQRGFVVRVAREAIGSHEPMHAAQTELYLRRRGIRFVPTAVIFNELEPMDGPGDWQKATDEIESAVRTARPPAESVESRAGILERVAVLTEEAAGLAEAIVAEIGKPICYARGEVARTAALFRAVAARTRQAPAETREPEALVRRRPHGTVAVITPWNNPVALAAGQLAPGFAFGNALLWKPAPAGVRCARLLHTLLLKAGLPPRAMQLMEGGAETGLELAAHPAIDAVCFTGSIGNGRVVAAACAARHKPLQAELGGNNAAIVTPECADLAEAARKIARAAFACAGQRCTATRRVIVLEPIFQVFGPLLEAAAARLAWGDPWLDTTEVGPLLNERRVEQVAGSVERAGRQGALVSQPHLRPACARPAGGAFFPPTLIFCDDPCAEIVQEETFGPVLVVQRADDFEHALALLNGVRHGLAAALFSAAPAQEERFLAEAQAGILKLNEPTADAGVDVPFGGWKASSFGPPQHGLANFHFFTRLQTVYVTR